MGTLKKYLLMSGGTLQVGDLTMLQMADENFWCSVRVLDEAGRGTGRTERQAFDCAILKMKGENELAAELQEIAKDAEGYLPFEKILIAANIGLGIE